MIVYIAFKNAIDWSGPPPVMYGIGKTVEESLISGKVREKDVSAWKSDEEIRAYYSVKAYDMETSPPKLLVRPDLEPGGGTVREDS